MLHCSNASAPQRSHLTPNTVFTPSPNSLTNMSTTTHTPSLQLSPKVNPSPTTPTTEDRPRKRAFRACYSCRARRVRCDVTVSADGHSCTNCRLDDKKCVVNYEK